MLYVKTTRMCFFLTFFQYFNLFFAAFFVLNTWRGHKGQTLTPVLTVILVRDSQTESYEPSVRVVSNDSDPFNILLDSVFCLSIKSYMTKIIRPMRRPQRPPFLLKILHGTDKVRILIFGDFQSKHVCVSFGFVVCHLKAFLVKWSFLGLIQ